MFHNSLRNTEEKKPTSERANRYFEFRACISSESRVAVDSQYRKKVKN